MPAQRYLDDFAVGETIASVARTLDASHFTLFSAVAADFHPIHLDHEYARSRGLPGPLAHGLHLLSLAAFGAAPESYATNDAMIAMLETRARYRKPATIGDTLTPVFEVAAVQPKDERRGILTLAFRISNQRGETVLEGEHVLMMKRRPPEGAAA